MSQATIDRPVIRRADNLHPQVHPGTGEAEFEKLLRRQGFRFTREPDTLDIEARTDGTTPKGITPDVRLDELPARLVPVGYERRPKGLYIELTRCDQILSVRQLPQKTRDKNRRTAASGKEFLPHPQLILRKRTRIAQAMALHDVDIILLTADEMDAILADPQLLADLLAPYLPAALARAQSQAA